MTSENYAIKMTDRNSQSVINQQIMSDISSHMAFDANSMCIITGITANTFSAVIFGNFRAHHLEYNVDYEVSEILVTVIKTKHRICSEEHYSLLNAFSKSNEIINSFFNK